MILCPLEGTIIFSKCPVTTCMWYKGTGSCGHGTTEPPLDPGETLDEDGAEEEVARVNSVKTNILRYVTVGEFLEARSGKELPSLVSSDFPKREEFVRWCRSKSVKGHQQIDYEGIVEHIKKEL